MFLTTQKLSIIPYRLIFQYAFLLYFFFGGSTLFSQTMTSTISSSGGSYNQESRMHYYWTLGRIIIEPTREEDKIFDSNLLNFYKVTTMQVSVNTIKPKIYPNPLRDVINIDLALDGSGKFHFELFSLTGKKVMSANLLSGKNVVQLGSLSSDHYVGRIFKDNVVVYTIKLTKQ